MNKIRNFGRQWLKAHPKVNPYQFTKENNPVCNLFRYITSDLSSLPSFIIIGSMKGGSTSLYSYVKMHPKISNATIKGSNFFTTNYDKSLKWYRSQFPILKDDMMCCETSVDYLPSKEAAKRIFETIPNCKFLVIFRNPVDRAYSHYINEFSTKRLDMSFEEALEIEKTGKPITSTADFTFLKRGFYEQHLKEWYKYFPKEQFYFIKSEDLKTDTVHTMKHVFKFLGLDSYTIPSTKKLHVREYGPMNAKTREKLSEIFKEPNKKLAHLLGTDIDWQ